MPAVVRGRRERSGLGAESRPAPLGFACLRNPLQPTHPPTPPPTPSPAQSPAPPPHTLDIYSTNSDILWLLAHITTVINFILSSLRQSSTQVHPCQDLGYKTVEDLAGLRVWCGLMGYKSLGTHWAEPPHTELLDSFQIDFKFPLNLLQAQYKPPPSILQISLLYEKDCLWTKQNLKKQIRKIISKDGVWGKSDNCLGTECGLFSLWKSSLEGR